MIERSERTGAPRRRAAARRSAPIFAALGDETRLGLVQRLSGAGPLSIARLTEGTSVTRQAVTKHLHVLEEAGLVRSSKLGRDRVWQLAPEPLATARTTLDNLSAQWDVARSRLRTFVEDA